MKIVPTNFRSGHFLIVKFLVSLNFRVPLAMASHLVQANIHNYPGRRRHQRGNGSGQRSSGNQGATRYFENSPSSVVEEIATVTTASLQQQQEQHQQQDGGPIFTSVVAVEEDVDVVDGGDSDQRLLLDRRVGVGTEKKGASVGKRKVSKQRKENPMVTIVTIGELEGNLNQVRCSDGGDDEDKIDILAHL